jgi:hypothetical protein
MAFLAIAQGAAAIGQKLFQGIKARRTARKEKRATRQAARDIKLATAEQNIFGSMQTPGIIPDSGISQAAAGFQNMFGGGGFVDQVQNREAIRLSNQDPEPGQNRMILIIGGAFLLFVLFGKKLLR